MDKLLKFKRVDEDEYPFWASQESRCVVRCGGAGKGKDHLGAMGLKASKPRRAVPLQTT